jgi:hypothetical protein
MALTQSISLKNNFGENTVFNDAYIKVRSVNFSKEVAQANVDYYGFDQSKLLTIKQYSFDVLLDGPNPIKQAYQFLKSLPEFSDAVDC